VRGSMDEVGDAAPLRTLVRQLLGTLVLGIALFLLFTVFNALVFHGFTDPEVLAIEAGAIVLVAFLVARAVSAASSAILARRGQVQHGALIRIFLNLLVAAGALLALSKLAGVSAGSIFLGSAFAGIVIGLAAQTVLANVFAGLLIVIANPFRPGDRVSFVSPSYSALAPSYPHELVVPSATGTIEDVGFIYTVMGLDSGGTAKIPNSVVLGALVLQPRDRGPRLYRVRMTFPLTVPVSSVEATLPEVAAALPNPGGKSPAVRLEVVDLSPTTWDGVVIFWSPVLDEDEVRDRVLRTILPRVAAPPAPSEKERARPAP
jgi:small-conductance mechanosensitive channel